MAKGHLLDTKTVNLNDVLGNGKIYKVPTFQRDYSWERDNWEDLWNDIKQVKETGIVHYMGSVVLQSHNGKEFQIIDGQQRFTTLSILILSLIDAIRKLSYSGVDVDENNERADLLMRKFIGHKDPSSLTYTSKLILNENNDGFYQSRLVMFKSPVNERKLSDSERQMWQAYVFFSDMVSSDPKLKTGAELATFINDVVGEAMMFIQITVEDEVSAYTVFETLNSRGVELTATDLLKNFFFSLVAKSPTDLQQVKQQWKKIIDTVGLKEFPVFLRYFLAATRKAVTKDVLYKEVKNTIKTGDDVFGLLDQLEQYAYIYVALSSPEDEEWNMDKENRAAIVILKAMRVTQWKPLAMVARQQLDAKEFKRLLQAIITISYRYNVIAKLQTNEMEKVYSEAAINLYKRKSQKIYQVLLDLKGLYVEDEDFKGYFSLKQFTGGANDKRLARYTLYKIEAQNGGGVHDFETDNGTIEHILPESYGAAWQEFYTEEEFSRHVYLLGNLTLLESSKNNKQAANKPYEEKVKVYCESRFKITNSIKNNQWLPADIKARQAEMARIATAIWRIDYNQITP